MTIIYMPLLNEGMAVWRPVEATVLSNNVYKVEGTVPDGEEWAFGPGSVVRCESRIFNGGEKELTVMGLAN